MLQLSSEFKGETLTHSKNWCAGTRDESSVLWLASLGAWTMPGMLHRTCF